MKTSKIIIIFGLIIFIVSLFYWAQPWKKDTISSLGNRMQKNIKPKDTGTGPFSNSTTNLPEVQKSSAVQLKDGDTYDLTASIVKKTISGKEVKMLAYNGSIPGPLIKVKKGAEITLNFKNNADVETTLHSHGVRVENKFDGVVDITQKEIGIGESFTYKIKFPDEGIFWYHPHVRDEYAQELGLYGNYLVEPENSEYWSPVNQEVVLNIDDVLMDEQGIVPFQKDISSHTLMGRFGNVMLVNGEENYTLQAKQGEVVRMYLVNTANTRVFNLSIPKAKMKLVGGDNGKYEKETFVDSIVLSPSERTIVEVYFDQAQEYTLVHTTPQKTYELAKVDISSNKSPSSYEKEFQTLRINKDTIRSIDPYRNDFDKQPDKSISLSLRMGMMGQENNHMMHDGNMMGNEQMDMMDNQAEPIEWEDTMNAMNAMSNSKMVQWKLKDTESNQENMDIQWQFKQGDKVKMKIFNDPKSQHPMQHPIHIHGQKFLVLSTNGKKNDNLVWKDTVLVPTGDTVEILVDMENKGTWMMHCHILEHIEGGMMSTFEVL